MTDEVLFWTQLAAIGQIGGAVATAAAVIVSLWVVLSDRTPRVSASAGLRMMVGGSGSAFDVMTFTLTNLGTRTVGIANAGWRMGWLPFGPKWLKFSYGVQMLGPPTTLPGSAVPPFDLAAGERKKIVVLVDQYEAHKRNDGMFTRRIPPLKEPTEGNIHFWIEIVGGRTKFVKVEKALAEFLATGNIGQGAAHFNALKAKGNDRAR